MTTVIGWGFALIAGTIILVNGVVMLASPRVWFRVPCWLLAKGSLVEQKYSKGWRSVEVRLTGAIIVAVIGWVLYDSLIR